MLTVLEGPPFGPLLFNSALLPLFSFIPIPQLPNYTPNMHTLQADFWQCL